MGIGRSSHLFFLLLAGSFLMHVALYLWLAELYRPDGLSVIELSVEEQVQKPAAREIPRPRFRPKHPPLPKELTRQSAEPKGVKSMQPPAVEPVDASLPDSLMAGVNVPDGVPAPSLAQADNFAPSSSGGAGSVFGSARQYYDMVRLKIESKKKYPRQAKAMRREGRVTVSFIIMPSGKIRDLAVEHSSGNKQLDQAALLAIRQSSPLPAPPRSFFSGPQTVELAIVFELF